MVKADDDATKAAMNAGDKFRHAFTISDDVYAGFISTFKDTNPLHTDAEFAAARGFKGKVMHGNILNGFLSFFVGETLPVKNVMIQMQTIKYMKPAFLHDVLELNIEIAQVFEAIKTYEFKYVFTNQAGQKIARGEMLVAVI